MEYRKLILTILLLSILPIASANLGYGEPGVCRDLRVVSNSSTINISTIYYPNDSIADSNKAMTKTGQTFIYTFCDTNQTGEYVYDYFDYTTQTGDVNTFWVTFNGKEPASGIVVVIFSAVLVFIVMSVTIVLIRSVAFMIESNFDLLDIAYNWGLYFALLIVYQLQFEYLGNEVFNDWILLFVKILAFPMLVVPIFAFFISFFREKKKKKQEQNQW